MKLELNDVLKFVQDRWDTARKEPSAAAPYAAMTDVRAALVIYENAHRDRSMAAFAKSIGMEVDVPDVDAAALGLLEAVERLPELSTDRGVRITLPTPTREQVIPPFPEDDDGPYVPRFPLLFSRLVAQTQRLQIVGGVVIHRKLEWVRDVLVGEGHNSRKMIDWLPTEDDPDSRGCERVMNQMKGGAILGVICFPDFMSHDQTDVLLKGGRFTNVPVALAGRGGQAQFLDAFARIEKALEQSKAA
jgi:hypothetical protein